MATFLLRYEFTFPNVLAYSENFSIKGIQLEDLRGHDASAAPKLLRFFYLQE